MSLTRTLSGAVIIDNGEAAAISVRPSTRGFDVMRANVLVASFKDGHEANGAARRLFEGAGH